MVAGAIKKWLLFRSTFPKNNQMNQTDLVLSPGTFADSLIQLPPAYMNKGLAEEEHTPGRTTCEGL
jgi:hypothetical protein